jgi:hypothetical protein
MFQTVVIVLEGRTSVVGRVNEDTFNLAGIIRQQRFERGQVVALDEQVLGVRFTVDRAGSSSSKR